MLCINRRLWNIILFHRGFETLEVTLHFSFFARCTNALHAFARQPGKFFEQFRLGFLEIKTGFSLHAFFLIRVTGLSINQETYIQA